MMLHELSSGVLVTGVGAPPGLGTVRSLKLADSALKIVAADLNPLAAGLFEPGVEARLLPAAGNADAYRAAVREICATHQLDIIIPGSEAEAAALAPVARDWARQGLRVPVPDPEVLRFGIDKGLLLTRIAEAGLPLPRTLQPDTAADLDSWDGDFPCVLKPRCSRGARGVSYPADMATLKRDWPQTVAEHGPSLVQQRIPGGPETIYTIGTLWNRGELVISTLHRKLQTNPPSGGAAIAGETVVDARLTEAGLAVLRATGPWHGLAAVELKRPSPDALPYLLEINPRMWGFGYLMTLAGLNVPALLVRMLAGAEHLDGHIPSTIPPYAPMRMVRSWQDVEVPLGVKGIT
ncbi:ATP-grasp domain-containing protein [Maricaulis salignorans]|uniref:ATP-grasp domain-containing protein n=1 Tax=Maricaulis salignorans TaxID=144026 RepID=A0A1G9VF25_9PROT|nr:ATP-grasp domain-containing protein [Maricaulis salignorans]SDM70822.1 ATP-grasp domain-containing protein [Maricaulis salignorans]